MLDLSEEYAMKKSRSHVHSEMTVTYRQIYEELANENGKESTNEDK